MLVIPAWWGGMPSWARKTIGYAAVGLVIFFFVRLYANRVWEQGFVRGREAGMEEMRKAKEKEWSERTKAIEDSKAKVETDRAALSAQAEELVKLRTATTDSLAQALAEARRLREVSIGKAGAIPADRLDDALRALSNELAAEPPH